MTARRPGQLKARRAAPLHTIGLLVLDVDGVLTDGRLYFSSRGEELKVFHVRDGHGIKLLMLSGVAVAAISGRRSAAVTTRMRELGVRHVVQACRDKVAALADLTRKLEIDPKAAACLVDDTPDLPLMVGRGLRRRGGGCASAGEIGRSLDQQGARRQGAVRELCDAILRARAGGRR